MKEEDRPLKTCKFCDCYGIMCMLTDADAAEPVWACRICYDVLEAVEREFPYLPAAGSRPSYAKIYQKRIGQPSKLSKEPGCSPSLRVVVHPGTRERLQAYAVHYGFPSVNAAARTIIENTIYGKKSNLPDFFGDASD